MGKPGRLENIIFFFGILGPGLEENWRFPGLVGGPVVIVRAVPIPRKI